MDNIVSTVIVDYPYVQTLGIRSFRGGDSRGNALTRPLQWRNLEFWAPPVENTIWPRRLR